MINKIKYLFLLILCAGFIGGLTSVSAQETNDKILVAGKQPLKQSEINKTVEFYEWLFETQFSADQRRRFAEIMVADYRQNIAKSRNGLDSLFEYYAKARALNQSGQQKVRDYLKPEFVKEIQRTAGDAMSQFLLNIYEGNNDLTASTDNQINDSTVSDDNPPSQSSSSNGSVSQSIVGKWSRGVGDGFVDYTGKTRYKAGETFTFEFFPDGTVEYDYDSDVLSIIQCRTKQTNKARGTVKVSGDTMTINLGATTSVGSSTCEKKDNFNRTLPASTVTKKFVVKRMNSITRPDNPMLLCFVGQNGESCFEKVGK